MCLKHSSPVKKKMLETTPGIPDHLGARSEICIVSPAYSISVQKKE